MSASGKLRARAPVDAPAAAGWLRSDEAARLASLLAETARETERCIDALLPPVGGRERRLVEAMRYATLGGGKRMRAFLAVQVAALFGVPRPQALRVAASVEMLHAYSLVHDDLPAMDDDDLRRGQPSTHRKFDEATAILAGDALQTAAFAVLADADTHPDPRARVELVAALAAASGAAGMVGGQTIDIEAERAQAGGETVTLAEVTRLHALKTGRLIQYSAEAGAILGRAAPPLRDAIAAYGRDVGTAFQIADDVLDATASEAELGKTAGKDQAAGKATFVSLLGVRDAAQQAARLAEQACEALAPFGADADALRALARFTVERRS